MALKKCRDCGNQVSTSAVNCPQCGAPINPQRKQYGCGTLILVLVVGGIWMSVFNSPSNNRPKKPEKPKLSDTECIRDLQCWASRHSVAASIVCAPLVERLAKHSHKWTDGMLDSKFPRIKWKDKDSGVVTYIGDKIQFQNGFGAWTNYVYECDYSPKSETVVDVRSYAGRI